VSSSEKTYVAAVVQNEIFRGCVVARVVDLNTLGCVDIDAANAVGGALPVWRLGCVVGRLYPQDIVAFRIDASAVEGILDTLVTASARDSRGSDSQNGGLESGLSRDRDDGGRSSGGGGAGGLADQQGAGARHDRSRVLAQDSGSRQGCRAGSHSSTLINASSGSGGAEGSTGDDRGDERSRSDGSNESAVAESCRAERLKSGVLNVLDSLVNSADSVALLGIEARV